MVLLPRRGAADKGNCFARLDMQINIVQYLSSLKDRKEIWL